MGNTCKRHSFTINALCSFNSFDAHIHTHMYMYVHIHTYPLVHGNNISSEDSI